MILSLVQLAVVVGSLSLLWKLVGQRIKQRSLRNLPGPPRKSLWSGNLTQIFDPRGWRFHDDIIAKYGGAVRIHGFAGDTQLYVGDPQALNDIIVKNQYIWEETSAFIEGNRLIFGMGLLSTLGDHHRQQRKLLNPVFSINHMRYMIPIFQRITAQLRDHLLSQVKTGPREIDILHWMTGTALELVGQGGLGYSFDALNPNSKNEYGAAAKLLAPVLFGLSLPRQFLPWFRMLGPHSLQKFVAKCIPSRRFQKLLTIVEVIDKTSKKIFTEKTAALAKGDQTVTHQVGEGRDIMSVLLKANLKASAEDKLQDEELLGQMNTILFAAMDTTSNALCRIFQLLSQNQDVQDKLRAEIVQAREAKDELDYDDLHTLPYLDAVCRETLRLWAPLAFISRTAREDTILPLGTPVQGEDGSMITEVFVPKNTDAIISIMGTNRNPGLWGPDAREWKPERWLSTLPESVTGSKVPGVYANLMTFLGGGRSCIGFKFSQMEMKVVLSTLMPVLRFSPAKEDIIWRLGGIGNPTVEASGLDTPTMPMELSIVSQ